uniref:Uncharacterized protein n=1 Tax=Salix viminalis TaxID=40686 RepID=A0A6N2KL96_SALVM
MRASNAPTTSKIHSWQTKPLKKAIRPCHFTFRCVKSVLWSLHKEVEVEMKAVFLHSTMAAWTEFSWRIEWKHLALLFLLVEAGCSTSLHGSAVLFQAY